MIIIENIKGLFIEVDKDNEENNFLISAKGKYGHFFEITREDGGFSFCWQGTKEGCKNQSDAAVQINEGRVISSYDDFKGITVDIYEDVLISEDDDVTVLKEGCIVMEYFFKEYSEK